MKIKRINETSDHQERIDRIKASGERISAKYGNHKEKKDLIDAIIYELYNSPNTKEDLIKLLNCFTWEDINYALDKYCDYNSDTKVKMLNMNN